MASKKSPAKKSAKPAAPKAPAKKAAAKPAAPKAPAKKAAAKPAAPKAPAKKAAKPAAPKAPAKKAAPKAKLSAKQASKPAKPAAKAPAKPAAKQASKPAAPAKPKATAAVKPKTPVLDASPVPALDGSAVKPNHKLTSFVIKQKQRLLDLRDELTDALVGVTRDTLRNAPSGSEASGSGMHQGDAGSDAYDRDFALSVLAKEQDALYEIAQALRRVDKGLYGVCEISGRKIPQARLEAIPFARLTVECQADWEKEHGNRRFRPANEVGFGGGFYESDESESVSLDDDED
jgi:DnaK suppressor protein